MSRFAVSAFSQGVLADETLIGLFDQLFTNVAATDVYDYFAKEDKLAGAITGKRSADTWQAWRKAKKAVAGSRPLEGFRHLKYLNALHSLDAGASSLADVERLALIGACLQQGYATVDALTFYDDAREALRQFIARFETEPDNASKEIVEMLEFLVNRRGFDKRDPMDLIRSWSTSRGLDLVLEVGQQRVHILSAVQGSDAAANSSLICDQLFDDLRHLHQATNTAFDKAKLAQIDFALGDCQTESDPAGAFEHFEDVVEALGVENGLGRQASINAANCLLRLGRFSEAEFRYASLESLFEMVGDYRGAARVWMSECIAAWKGKHDPSVRRALAGAIKMYEENLPPDADVMTLYGLKKYIEQAYLLLVTVNGHGGARTEDLQDETLAAIWALMSRDLLARLESKVEDDEWKAMLERARRPLAATKAMLAPLPGVGVVHLVSGVDCLVWLIYGFDRNSSFRFEMSAFSRKQTEPLVQFLEKMTEQLEADKARDALRVEALNARIEELGDQIGSQLSAEWINAALVMDHLFYMPHPYGNVAEFPLGGLRVDGKWLGEIRTITRSPTINHLRELLMPNRAAVGGNGKAVVVVGNPSVGGPLLTGTVAEAKLLAGNYLPAFGFEATLSDSATSSQMIDWVNGQTGLVHYVGHGIANPVTEVLPLAAGDGFTTSHIDRIDGRRTPFVFICACVAARIRYGAGGYQAGLTSKLIERGAPAALAFTLPVPEPRAYEMAHQFYRQADKLPFGKAVSATQFAVGRQVPNYMRLALAAYGDPELELGDLPKARGAKLLNGKAATWHSLVRNHCVLRTAGTEIALRDALDSVPSSLKPLLSQWLDVAFQKPAASSAALLTKMEASALKARGCTDLDRLSLRSAACAERAHAAGLESIPLYIPTDAASIRKLLDDAHFLTVLGGVVFDMRLNGLGNTLIGRVITVDQNGIEHSAFHLKYGLEKLHESEDQSPFVRQLREGNQRILKHFGG